jgi:hypothetical protein
MGDISLLLQPAFARLWKPVIDLYVIGAHGHWPLCRSGVSGAGCEGACAAMLIPTKLWDRRLNSLFERNLFGLLGASLRLDRRLAGFGFHELVTPIPAMGQECSC